MADDWIRMRVNLATHPKVIRAAEVLLADERYLEWSGLTYSLPGYPPSSRDEWRAERNAALRVTRCVCVTSLLRFWGYANEHAKGEHIDWLTPENVDEITGVPGIGNALEAVGWLVAEPEGGLVLPDFSEHNTSAEVRKSSSALRQKAYRERKKQQALASDVTRDVTSHAREEKRREEDIPPVPRKRGDVTQAVPAADLVLAGFTESVASEFIAYKAAKKAPLTPRAWQLHLAEAKKAGWSAQRAAEHVMAKGWKGFEADYVAGARDVSVTSRMQTQDVFAGAR